MFFMSVAAWAAAFGSFEVTVCGAMLLPWVLLVETRGEVGLPLGCAWFGTGDARLGGAVAVPLGVAMRFESVRV